MNIDFKIIKEQEDALKIDKELIEVQKTIIYYGEKIIQYFEQMTLDLKALIDHKTTIKDKEKQVIKIEEQGERKEIGNNPFIIHLEKLKDVRK